MKKVSAHTPLAQTNANDIRNYFAPNRAAADDGPSSSSSTATGPKRVRDESLATPNKVQKQGADSSQRTPVSTSSSGIVNHRFHSALKDKKSKERYEQSISSSSPLNTKSPGPLFMDLTASTSVKPALASAGKKSFKRTTSPEIWIVEKDKLKNPTIINKSLVFDIGVGLKGSDPGLGLSSIKSLLMSGQAYASNLLVEELFEAIVSTDDVENDDVQSIYYAFILALDNAYACDRALQFPRQWSVIEDLFLKISEAEHLNDPTCERHMIALQVCIQSLVRDFYHYRSKREQTDKNKSKTASSSKTTQEDDSWIRNTRVSHLLCNPDGHDKERKKLKVQNTQINQCIDRIVDLWKLMYASSSSGTKSKQPPKVHISNVCETVAMSCIRLLEILCMLSSQTSNIVARIQASLEDKEGGTEYIRTRFYESIQMPTVKLCMATNGVGLSRSGRSQCEFWPLQGVLAHAHREMFLRDDNDALKDPTRDNILSYAPDHLDSYKGRKNTTSSALLMKEILAAL